jgi:hypothetical protein
MLFVDDFKWKRKIIIEIIFFILIEYFIIINNFNMILFSSI